MIDSQLENAADVVICHSAAMRSVLELAARAGRARVGVLIRGEAGSGRAMIARAIHRVESEHAPFVAIDCAAFLNGSVPQLDGVLFGVARIGASDSARELEHVTRESRIYTARGGTILLENIADLPARVQARLARILRDREAVLVETGETIDIDVRPVASIEPSAEAMIKEARIREDLLRYLSEIAIDMPPLRGRREDISALAHHFVREICSERSVPVKTLARSAVSLLTALPWRGNAAELRSLLRNIISHSMKPTIEIDDVLGHVRLDGGSVVFANRGTLRQARAQFERDYIAAVLEQHRGRISDAARTLGIQRTNLYRKMRSLHVPRGA